MAEQATTITIEEGNAESVTTAILTAYERENLKPIGLYYYSPDNGGGACAMGVLALALGTHTRNQLPYVSPHDKVADALGTDRMAMTAVERGFMRGLACASADPEEQAQHRTRLCINSTYQWARTGGFDAGIVARTQYKQRQAVTPTEQN